MCGIAAIISRDPGERSRFLVENMVRKLRNRGPDGEGFWNSEDHRIWLGHRRLAIYDLTEAAGQPLHYMHYTILFNGAIYNFKALKQQLTSHGYRFTTQGDTEVIPAVVDHWGMEGLNRLDGMFAFVLIDHRQRRAMIARDRFGEKPLYYYTSRTFSGSGRLERLVLASDLTSLWEGQAPREPSFKMILNYVMDGMVQNPADKAETFFERCLNLLPGHWLDLDLHEYEMNLRQWYFPRERIEAAGPLRGTPDDLVAQFRHLFLQSVSDRLEADVKVGTSLSGGVDSSSVVGAIDHLVKQQNGGKSWGNVCFSAVFPGFPKNEDRWSGLVSDYFKLQRYTVETNGNEVVQSFEDFFESHAEPVASASAFVQYKVYEAAKARKVKVLLDGQGADETLAGYQKYSRWFLQQMLRQTPGVFLREKPKLRANNMLPDWDLRNYAAAFFPGLTARQLQKRAIRRQNNQRVLTISFVEGYLDKDSLVRPRVKTLDDMLYYNTFHYGLEELLRYADRNSMAHGCEVRLPFLQHELVEFLFRLPATLKMHDGFGKWILRKAMEPELPPQVAWRTDKIGFEPPQGAWLQGRYAREFVMSRRRELIKNLVVDSDYIYEPIRTSGPHDPENYDWRLLNVASLLFPRLG